MSGETYRTLLRQADEILRMARNLQAMGHHLEAMEFALAANRRVQIAKQFLTIDELLGEKNVGRS